MTHPIEQIELKIKQIGDLLTGEEPEVVGPALMVIVARYFAASPSNNTREGYKLVD